MFVACGLSQYSLGLFHLFNHAFFKALLFLAAGSVIHAITDEQDIRKMGGLFYYLPLTLTFFTLGSLSLMGMPYLSGFYSKDIILEFSLFGDAFTYWGLISAAVFTSAYSTRLLFYVFLTRPNFFKINLAHTVESNLITQGPLIFLTLCSLFSGYYFNDLFIGFGSTYFSHAIAPLTSFHIEIEFVSPFFKQLPFLLMLVSSYVTYNVLSQQNIQYLSNFFIYKILCFLNHKWFFDKVYNTMILGSFRVLYYWFFSFLDKGLIEVFGPTGLHKNIQHIGQSVRSRQTGVVSTYMVTITFFFVVILCVFNFLVLA
jgi:NADH-ubiquinone oxidoreductase chain 5